MIDKTGLIEVWQIWKVTTDLFLTSGEDEAQKNWGRQTLIRKDELIEIRYPYAWHFRTIDNFYFHASHEAILQNCSLYWKIREKVRWNNNAKLEDIIKLNLFDKVDNG